MLFERHPVRAVLWIHRCLLKLLHACSVKNPLRRHESKTRRDNVNARPCPAERRACEIRLRAERKANESSGTRPTFAEMQARRTESQQQLITKLTGVLTDAQITKLKVLMEPEGGRGAGHRGPPPAAGN